MKKKLVVIGLVALIGVFSATAIALGSNSKSASTEATTVAAGDCTGDGEGTENHGQNGAHGDHESDAVGGGHGYGNGGGGNGGGGHGEGTETGTHVASDPSQPLSDADAAGLVYMREEEKLAHDVYVALAETYGLRAFSNIARSETHHTDSIKQLLDIYSIDDPVGDNGAGEFEDAQLQQLYTSLMKQSEGGLVEALKVAIAIEETDIADLEERIAATDREDLQSVYGNLLRASQNHLRTFTNHLEAQTD